MNYLHNKFFELDGFDLLSARPTSGACIRKLPIHSRRDGRRLRKRMRLLEGRSYIPIDLYRCSNCKLLHLGHDYLMTHPKHRETYGYGTTSGSSLVSVGLLAYDQLVTALNSSDQSLQEIAA